MDGPASLAQFNSPYGIAIDPFNGNIIVSDSNNQVIRLINVTSNMVSTLAGVSRTSGFLDGPASLAKFSLPQGIAIDPTNGNIIVSDVFNSAIRLIDVVSNNVSTLAGNGIRGYVNGAGDMAEFFLPSGIALDPSNRNLLVVDRNNQVIRSICYNFESYFIDFDSDGFGSNATALLCQSTVSIGFSTNSLDCNDHVSYIHPGQQEICNSIDDNCNDLTDEGVKTTYYEDMNGKIELNVTIQACSPPPGYVMYSSSLFGQQASQQQHSSNHHSANLNSNHNQKSVVNSANHLEFKAILLASFLFFCFFMI